jgi:MoaA/NifB/PqqE/SkfB family radical SAM enzyme
MHLSRLLPKLTANGIRYRYLRTTGKRTNPEALSIEVTRRCIARCIMCHIWKTPQSAPELPVSNWIRLLSSPIFADLKELDITGGEPFLREDLPDLIKGVCELKQDHLRGLRSIAVTTNGFLTGKVLDCVQEVAGAMEEMDIDLILACALDAVGDLHDLIRNFTGGWKRLDKTIQGLRNIRTSFANVIIGLKTTIVPSNVDQLDQIASYARENGLFSIISPCIITANRYDNVDRRDDLRFSPGQLEKMIRFYEGPLFKWSCHGDMLLRFLREGVVHKPCSAGFNYFFIRSTGDVYPCPIIPAELGNFSRTSFDQLIDSEVASRFRRKVGRFSECGSCTEPGLERYALPFEGFHYMGLLIKLGRNNFFKLHEHMGLNKYL